MVLLAAVIMPHGTMPYDGNPDSESGACQKRHRQLDPIMREHLSALYEGMCAVGRIIADLRPDLVILNSPHGICLSDAFGVYMNDTSSGNALWNGEWSEFAASVSIDADRSQQLKSFFESNGIPVQGVRSFGGLECKLRWGEVVPLWYHQQYMTSGPKYIITTNDTQPKPSVVEDWRLDAGKKLGQFVAGLPEKVVVLISGDLAHFHPTDCTNPLYLPDPSAHMPVNKEGSEAFEASIAAWINGRVDGGDCSKMQFWDPSASYEHLKAAIEVEKNAGACGSKGFVLLHGLMAEEVANGARFIPKIAVHRVPTYYGMMAATFLKD